MWTRPSSFVYLLLVIYQVHQIEEHYGGRFRRYVNETMANGADVLTPRATMWINVGGVWALYLAFLQLTVLVESGSG